MVAGVAVVSGRRRLPRWPGSGSYSRSTWRRRPVRGVTSGAADFAAVADPGPVQRAANSGGSPPRQAVPGGTHFRVLRGGFSFRSGADRGPTQPRVRPGDGATRRLPGPVPVRVPRPYEARSSRADPRPGPRPGPAGPVPARIATARRRAVGGDRQSSSAAVRDRDRPTWVPGFPSAPAAPAGHRRGPRHPAAPIPEPPFPPPTCSPRARSWSTGRRPVEEAFAARRPAIRAARVPQRRMAHREARPPRDEPADPIVEVEGGTLTSFAGLRRAAKKARRWWSGVPDHQPRRCVCAARASGANRRRAHPRFARRPREHGHAAAKRRGVACTASCFRRIARRRSRRRNRSTTGRRAPARARRTICGALADLHVRGLRSAPTGSAARRALHDLRRGPITLVIGERRSGLRPSGPPACRLPHPSPMRRQLGSLNAAGHPVGAAVRGARPT